MVPAGPVDGAELELHELFPAGVGQQALDRIARLDGADAGGRARQDQVSFLRWGRKVSWGGEQEGLGYIPRWS